MIRNNNRRRLLTSVSAICLLFIAAAAGAQSPFALTNIGGDVRSSDARIDGRGGWGMAESDTIMPSFHNIAGLPGLKKIAVMVSGYGEQVESETADRKRRTDRVRTPLVRAAVPVWRGRMVLTAGFNSLRATQYQYAEPREWPADPDTLFGTRFFSREGTQFQLPVGVGFRVGRELSVGATVNFVHGMIRDSASNFFFDSSGADSLAFYAGTTEIQEDQLSGTSTTLSMMWNPSERAAVGVGWTSSYDWDIDRTTTLTGVSGTRTEEMTWSMPSKWSVGGHYFLSDRWRLGLDYEAQDFSDFTGRDDWAEMMTDSWRFATGVERIGGSARRDGMGNMPLRLGYSVQKWPYQVGGEDVMEHRVSIGSGVPFKGRSGHLDFAVTYGWRGEIEKNGSEDRFWRMSVSLVGLEKWW